eukprot:5184179-Heterocapsa_arctica.AAC.1
MVRLQRSWRKAVVASLTLDRWPSKAPAAIAAQAVVIEAGVCATSVNSSCAGVAFDRMLFPAKTPRARYLASLSRP